MARIAGVDIPREKRLEISLTYIFGIGKPTAQKICAELELDPNTKVRDLTEDEVNKIRAYVDEHLTVEGDLRRDVQQDIKRKIEIGCLPGHPPPQGPARPRSAHPHQRPHPQGPEAHRCQQEEGCEEVMAKPKPGGRRPRKRERKNVSYGVCAHQELVQQHDRVDHRHRGQRDLVGLRRRGRLQGLAQEHAVRAQLAAETAATAAMEHGLSKVEVQVKGPGSGRDTAIRSIQNTGIEVTSIKDVTPVPHNGCRQPEAPEELVVMARYTGPKVRVSRRLGTNIFENEKGRQALERRPFPPGQHGRTRRRNNASEYLLQLQEKQKAKYIYGVLERQFRHTYDEANRQQGADG